MTEAKSVDLSAVSEGVANLAEAYKEPTDRVLDPKTDGGIYLPDAVVQEQTVSTQVGYVLKVGDLAYLDTEKFPTGSWCAEGDWVMFARYSGSRFKIDGGEVRILNDDEVLAKILEPEDILHF